MNESENKKAWASFDEAFKLMNRAFNEMDWRYMDDIRHVQNNSPEDLFGRKIHYLQARTWKSRYHMAKLFAWLAFKMITRGKVAVRL